MVSLASEQWPDTVLPTVDKLEPPQTASMVLSISSKHFFDAWEQTCLELSKIPCQVVCQFGQTPLQKTLLYGSRVMPLRIFENVHRCDVRGFVRNGDKLDVICTDSSTFKGNLTGWRVLPKQIVSLEIRTGKGTMTLRCSQDKSGKYWLCEPAANELSCWMCSVSSNENRRANAHYILEGLENDGILTANMINILK